MSSYTILSTPAEFTTEKKNSKFLTCIHPATSRDEATTQIDFYRKNTDANHVCWAHVIAIPANRKHEHPVMMANLPARRGNLCCMY